MEKIASFTIDHIKLKPGVYVSRKDHVGDSIITTFDLRMTSPNDEPVMNTAEVHTIELDKLTAREQLYLSDSAGKLQFREISHISLKSAGTFSERTFSGFTATQVENCELT